MSTNVLRAASTRVALLGALGASALAVSAPVYAQSTPSSCAVATQIQVNGGFETPDITQNATPRFQQVAQGTVPGWSTTDTSGTIEIWESGFVAGGAAPVPSDSGNQFAELNSRQVAALSQTGSVFGNAELFVTWSHRARANNTTGATLSQTATATITDNTGATVNTGNFTADSTAWVPHTQLLVAGSGATQFTMTFTSTGSGSGAAQGNFLDSVTACQTYITLTPAVIDRTDVDSSGGDSAGDTVTVQYTISNPAGNLRPLEDVTVGDDEVGTFVVTSPDSGDTNGDGILDPGETWIVTRPYTITQDDMDNAETSGFQINATVSGNGDTTDNVVVTDAASYSFPITPLSVVATNDSVSGADGVNGDPTVLNVFTGDTIGTAPASATNAILSVATGSSVPPELTFDPLTGDVGVAAGTPSGSYSFNYEICEAANPLNCEIATVTVNVPAAPSLEMTKVADEDQFVTVGQVITYTYTITNTGNEIVRGVTVGDVHNGAGAAPVPGGETLLSDNGTSGDSNDTTSGTNGSWDILAPGDVITFTGTYTVQQADIDDLQ